MFLTTAAAVAVLAVAGALVIRAVRPSPAPGFDLSAIEAATIAAPEGEDIVAAGAAPGAVILVTRDRDGRERLRFFDARTGEPGSVVAVERRR